MRDKPFKDGHTVWQTQDIEAVQRQLRKELPGKRLQQIQSAIDQCKRYVQPSEGREKLIACIREKLAPTTAPPASTTAPPSYKF
jgi:hypothetical protein